MRSIVPLFAAALLASAPALASEPVSVPQFRSVELRGGGTIEVVPGPAERVSIVEGSSRLTRITVERDGQLRIDACTQTCPQGYAPHIRIEAPQVPALAVDGGGQIRAGSGFAAQLDLAVAVHGGGRIDARSVDAQHVSAAVDGGGAILVRPRQQLAAAVNGGGHIRYLGNPSTSVAIHGGGDVSRGD